MKRLAPRLRLPRSFVVACAVSTLVGATAVADVARAGPRGSKAKTTEPAAPAEPEPPPSSTTSTTSTSSASSTSLPSVALTGGMSLDDAVTAALAARPELAAARARVQARHDAVTAAWAPFVPRLVLGAGVDQSRTPIAGPFNSFFQRDDTLDTQRMVVGVGVVEDLPTGTRVELRADGSVGQYSFYAEALNPRYEPALRLRVSQALWKGFSSDVNLAPVAVADANVSVEDAALAARAQAVVLEVVEAWLDASRAATLVLLRQQSVALASNFEQLTRQLIDGGSLSRLDLALALQTVAQRLAELTAAQADADLAAGRLGEVLGSAPSSTSAALPAVAGLGAPSGIVPALDAVTAQVLDTDPGLRTAQAALQRARAQAPLIDNPWAPDIRVVVDGSVSGVAGTTTCREGFLSDGITSCHVPDAYDGGFDKAAGNLFSGQLYAVGVKLEGEIPAVWGPWSSSKSSAAADIAAATADVAAVQQRLQWRARRLLHDVEQRQALLDAATANLQLAAFALDAEETKLRGGRSTGFALLRAQELRVGAAITQTDARYQLAAARARLFVLMGQRSVGDVAVPPSTSPSPPSTTSTTPSTSPTIPAPTRLAPSAGDGKG
jgi:outer membrane protein TolC